MTNSPNCLAPSAAEIRLTPVALPPGRFKLVTRSLATGSTANENNRNLCGRGLTHGAAGYSQRSQQPDHCKDPQPSPGSRSVLALRPTVFNRDVLSLDIARFLEFRRNPANVRRVPTWRRPIKEPDHRYRRLLGARRSAAIVCGVPPRRVMINSRRLICLLQAGPRFAHESGPAVPAGNDEAAHRGLLGVEVAAEGRLHLPKGARYPCGPPLAVAP